MVYLNFLTVFSHYEFCLKNAQFPFITYHFIHFQRKK